MFSRLRACLVSRLAAAEGVTGVFRFQNTPIIEIQCKPETRIDLQPEDLLASCPSPDATELDDEVKRVVVHLPVVPGGTQEIFPFS